MNTNTVNVPAINCSHCTHTIEMELGELDGVASVSANESSKDVTIEWQEPATWDAIRELLVEIDFPPAAND